MRGQIIGSTTVCVSVGGTSGYQLTINCQYPASWSLNGGGTVSGSFVTIPNDYPAATITWNTSGTWTLTATSSVGCNNSTSYQLNIIVNIIPAVPVISSNSSNYALCSNQSWMLTANSSGYPTNYGYDWYTTGGLLINGLHASLGSPVHSSLNTATLSSGEASGLCFVYARLNNDNSCPSNYGVLTLAAGPPTIGSLNKNINNPPFCVGTTVPVSISGSGGNPYTWTSNNPSILEVSGSRTNGVLTGDVSGSCTFTVAGTNNCGYASTNFHVFVQECSGGIAIIASPNPVSSLLTVQITDRDSKDLQPTLYQPFYIFIMDWSYRRVLSAQSSDRAFTISMESFPAGIYYLKVLYEGEFLQKQIIVRH
ncbi:MAG: hypothetical protein JSS93_00605 [Bacteroidetes bacterium]|nr:hypothetical protein [Bacteroidota bacterium]